MDVDGGVGEARPGRGRWVGLTGVAVVVVLGVTVGVVLAVRGGSEPSQADSSELAWDLPAVVEPDEGAEPLPAAGAVGEGALVYACRSCGTRLVLADGTQRVIAAEVSPATLGYSLSPDGRWLTVPGPGAVVVRDLTGDRSYRVEGDTVGFRPWVWSPDSRWLLLEEVTVEAGATAPGGYRLLDLTDGAETAVAAPSGGREYVAVLPSGMLWAVNVGRGDRGGPVTAVEVAVVDPASPEPDTASAFTADAGDWLEAGESLAEPGGEFSSDGIVTRGGVQLLPAPDADGLFLGVFGDAASPVAVLRAGPDGRVEQRWDISFEDPRGLGWIAGRAGDEVLVAQAEAMSDRPAFAVALYAVSGSGLREVTRLEPGQVVRVAGAAIHGGSTF